MSTGQGKYKNVAYNFSDAQVKAREATSNYPWGPSTALMSEIADLTPNLTAGTNEPRGALPVRLTGCSPLHYSETSTKQSTIETQKDFQRVEDSQIPSLLSDDGRLEESEEETPTLDTTEGGSVSALLTETAFNDLMAFGLVENPVSDSDPQDVPHEFTLDSAQIEFDEQLGEGSFAVVKRGTWVQVNGQSVDVAVKILRDVSPSVMDDLKVEASHMLKLQHPSVIRLYGIVSQPPMMVCLPADQISNSIYELQVFELCEGGSLLDRLHDDKKPILLVPRLHQYCIQIAKALEYLQFKRFVHRDVAARNILLVNDEKTVKLADFGLSIALEDTKETYKASANERVPFAWCSPEALQHGHFSFASDTWAFGVLMWEMFTFGMEPWVDCNLDIVSNRLSAGERLKKPEYCDERIYELMKLCWKANLYTRIEIGDIIEELEDTYPPVIPAPTNHAVVTASSVTPQIVPAVNVQQTIQPTVVPIVNSKHAKEEKAKAERLRVAAFKEKAAPSVHEMQSRNQVIQAKFAEFCQSNAMKFDDYKIPSKTIIQQWKNNALSGIHKPLLVTLFEQHLCQVGFKYELALYLQIEDFKK